MTVDRNPSQTNLSNSILFYFLQILDTKKKNKKD